MKRLTLALTILVLNTALFAINDNAGTSGFNFLKMNFSSKAAAMGGAYTGNASGTDGVSYNSAALAQLETAEISTGYMNYIDGIHIGSVTLVKPLNDKVGLSVFGKFLSADDDRTTIDGFGNYSGIDGTFGMSDLVIGAGFGMQLNETVDVGVTAKYIQEKLDESSATAVALDFSILHQTPNPAVKVGLAYKNIGKQLSYFSDEEHEENLPTEFVGGLYYHMNKFSGLLDVAKPNDFDLVARLGAEYQVHELLSLRTGYKSNGGDWRNGGDLEFLSGLSFGAGFSWKKYNIDYAISSYGDLGMVNQISLVYQF